MSLTLSLNNALTGLNVNQRTMAVISNNIANANTEGYSRQIVNLSPQYYDNVGSGVRIEEITRKVDEYLQVSVYNQTSATGYTDALTDYYDNIQILLGDPALGNSIDEYVSDFFNDMQQMAETPERTSTRQAVIESATILTREIANLARGLEELRFRADNELAADANSINQILQELFFTNEAIAEADSFGNPTTSLLDERDGLLEELAQFVDIRATENANRTVDVYTGNGVNLLDYGYSQLSYSAINTLDVLTEDNEINPIVLQEIDQDGDTVGNPINLVSGGRSSQIESRFSSGKLVGLLDMRDQVIPDMLAQLDELASSIRDQFNAIHNTGSGYPPATELVGTAAYSVSERSSWEGLVRIAALNEDGTPIDTAFTNEVSAMRPLELNLASLYSGANIGEVDTQTIIDEINNHFGIQQNQMSFGNLQNVELSIVSDEIPGTGQSVEFDFDIENISGQRGDFWIDSIQVLDDTAADITSTTNTISTLTLDAASTFTTTAGSNVVTVMTVGNHGLVDGDRVRLDDPGLAINGIPAAEFDGYFEVSNVTNNTFEVTVVTNAGGTGPVGVAAQIAEPPYSTIPAGNSQRTLADGTISADLSGNPGSAFYDINVEMSVRDEDGTVSTTTVTYRVLNNEVDTLNDRVAASAIVAGSGVIAVPNDVRPILRAYLADENGVELPDTAGDYGEQEGFLVIESMREGVTFAIDEIDTRHLGLPADNPPRPGSDRGFSYHYGLNNFFSSNEITALGDDTTKNSALNFAIESRLRENPARISSGNLQLSNQPGDPDADPLYTYELYSGDHSVAQQLAKLGIEAQNFDSAGGLPGSILTYDAYAGEMLGYITANAIGADRTADNNQVLLEGYLERADAVSGVNLDEELANTIIYQNAYTASARVITVTDELFDALLNAV